MKVGFSVRIAESISKELHYSEHQLSHVTFMTQGTMLSLEKMITSLRRTDSHKKNEAPFQVQFLFLKLLKEKKNLSLQNIDFISFFPGVF